MTDTLYDPKSRFQVFERPVSHPGKCRCCGSAGRRVVDMGADDEEGVIYLCENCVIEAAMRFGAVPGHIYERLLAEQTETLRVSEKAGEYANELAIDISFATSRFFDRIRGVATPENSETGNPDSNESGNSDSEDSGNAEPTSDPDSKSPSKSGSSRVSAATGDDSIFKLPK